MRLQAIPDDQQRLLEVRTQFLEALGMLLLLFAAPVNAIVPEEDAAADQRHKIALNAELAIVAGWPTISKRKSPLQDADEWKDRTEKLVHLIR